MLVLSVGVSLVPLAASAQTASPSPGNAPVEQREEHHGYGWIGLLGLIGLAGLLGRRHDDRVTTRPTSTR
jgi:MYXO-CTERM domain-containing protein